MGLFSRKASTPKLLNPFHVAENFGHLVLEQFEGASADLEEIRLTWAPVMAAVTRAAEREGTHKPMIDRFKTKAAIHGVQTVIEKEIQSRNEAYYDPIFKNQSDFQFVSNQILSQSYETALMQAQRTGKVNSSSVREFAMIVLSTYISERKGNLKFSDEFYVNAISQATSRSAEELWENLVEYGVDNSQIYMKINSAVIATATVLRYAS